MRDIYCMVCTIIYPEEGDLTRQPQPGLLQQRRDCTSVPRRMSWARRA